MTKTDSEIECSHYLSLSIYFLLAPVRFLVARSLLNSLSYRVKNKIQLTMCVSVYRACAVLCVIPLSLSLFPILSFSNIIWIHFFAVEILCYYRCYCCFCFRCAIADCITKTKYREIDMADILGATADSLPLKSYLNPMMEWNQTVFALQSSSQCTPYIYSTIAWNDVNILWIEENHLRGLLFQLCVCVCVYFALVHIEVQTFVDFVDYLHHLWWPHQFQCKCLMDVYEECDVNVHYVKSALPSNFTGNKKRNRSKVAPRIVSTHKQTLYGLYQI